jgi:hypothetical protein
VTRSIDVSSEKPTTFRMIRCQSIVAVFRRRPTPASRMLGPPWHAVCFVA